MNRIINKFFTEEFLTVKNVDGHKIILRTEFVVYIAEDVKNHMAYIHLSTGKTLTLHLMGLPPLNHAGGDAVYNNSSPKKPNSDN